MTPQAHGSWWAAARPGDQRRHLRRHHRRHQQQGVEVGASGTASESREPRLRSSGRSPSPSSIAGILGGPCWDLAREPDPGRGSTSAGVDTLRQPGITHRDDRRRRHRLSSRPSRALEGGIHEVNVRRASKRLAPSPPCRLRLQTTQCGRSEVVRTSGGCASTRAGGGGGHGTQAGHLVRSDRQGRRRDADRDRRGVHVRARPLRRDMRIAREQSSSDKPWAAFGVAVMAEAMIDKLDRGAGGAQEVGGTRRAVRFAEGTGGQGEGEVQGGSASAACGGRYGKNVG